MTPSGLAAAEGGVHTEAMTATTRIGAIASATSSSLVALGVGLALGVIGHASGAAAFRTLLELVRPLGDLWLAGLQMTVLPLVITHLTAAIVGAPTGDSIGALGIRALSLFVALLLLAGVVTLVGAPLLVASLSPDPGAVASLQAATSVPDAARQAATASSHSIGDWIAHLLSPNLFESARRGDILSLLLFVGLFGLAVRRLPDEQRETLTRVATAGAAAMMVLVKWMLLATPIGVFVLGYALAIETGSNSAGILGGLVVVQCAMMVVFTALLYPLSAFLGRTSLGAFARAVAPAQLVAVSTRSSIAALPALIDGGRKRLDLPASATSFVLPFCVSLFKVNRTISSTAKVLFLAHIYGVPLGAGTLGAFMLTVIILSFSSVGVPGGGSAFKTLPAYLAAGIPIEGVVIAEAVEAIPDIFKTLVNVTGDMSVATLLSRAHRAPASVLSPVPEAVGSPERAV